MTLVTKATSRQGLVESLRILEVCEVELFFILLAFTLGLGEL